MDKNNLANKGKQPTTAFEANQWKPGQSGNPSGRPKLPVSLTKILREILEEKPGEAKAIVVAHINAGKAKDMRAIVELYDRIDGKVTQPVSGVADGEPIIFKVIYGNGEGV